MSKKITIEPVTRAEGHGKVTIHLGDNNEVLQSRLHIVEFRGFEKFIQGRPYWEIPVLVQRLCGICPVSHHLAASKAMDVIVGAGIGDGLTPTAEKMRRLMHYGQIFQSHVLHFFYMATPDFLFGIDSDPLKRNVINIIKENKDLAVQAVMMRKYGQEIIKATAGKKIHGTGSIPGGINKHLTLEEKDSFVNGDGVLNIEQMIKWSLDALDFFKSYHKNNKDFIDRFFTFPSNYLSLTRSDGALDFYHGNLKAIDPEGNILFDNVDCQEYANYITEEARSWTYMKFPYIKSLGKKTGWFTVGPLARMNTAKFIDTELANKELTEFKNYTHGKPNHMPMHMHWARLIEVLHSAEKIKQLLNDPDILMGELIRTGERKSEGVGIIEAPRGTLFHYYKVGENDLVTMCNLVVATTNNNQPMNNSISLVANSHLAGHTEITEGMLNAIEIAIRAYDPCLSCATHAIGQMPLIVEIYDKEEKLIASKVKST